MGVPILRRDDIAMPRLEGFEAARQILRSNPDARLVFVTGHADSTVWRH